MKPSKELLTHYTQFKKENPDKDLIRTVESCTREELVVREENKAIKPEQSYQVGDIDGVPIYEPNEDYYTDILTWTQAELSRRTFKIPLVESVGEMAEKAFDFYVQSNLEKVVELFHAPKESLDIIRADFIEKWVLGYNQNQNKFSEELVVGFVFWLRENYDTHEKWEDECLDSDKWRPYNSSDEITTKELLQLYISSLAPYKPNERVQISIDEEGNLKIQKP